MKFVRKALAFIPGCLGIFLAIVSGTIGFASLMCLELADWIEGSR